MKFSVPRDNPDSLLIYIWKIIDISHLYYDDLLYKLVFDYFLFRPDEASSFVDDALKSGILIEDQNKLLTLSDDLNRRFQEWQKKRRLEIKKNILTRKKRKNVVKKIQNNNKSTFNQLLMKITDSAALNRAVTISDDAVNILNADKKEGLLEAKIKGSKEHGYLININTKEKTLIHNCHDFETRRAKAKTFCKHLIKLFLTLKRENEELALFFLESIINQINNWDFTS